MREVLITRSSKDAGPPPPTGMLQKGHFCCGSEATPGGPWGFCGLCELMVILTSSCTVLPHPSQLSFAMFAKHENSCLSLSPQERQ